MRDRLIELLDKAFLESDDNYGRPCTEQVAEHLLAGGVIVPPCKVGSTMYRIDTISVQCSHLRQFYDEYYCSGCCHLLNGDCDAHKKPYIYEMKNVNAQTIFGNEHLIGTRVFLTRSEAEKALAERRGE